MVERRATLWCQVLQKRVRVILVKKEGSPDEIWIPKGWSLRRCLDKGFSCVGKECPFAIIESKASERARKREFLILRFLRKKEETPSPNMHSGRSTAMYSARSSGRV